MSIFFSFLSAIVNLYTILCLINILLSWFPGAKFTGFGKFVYSCTEPFLGFFRRFGIFRIGYVDFSPIIPLALLSLVSSVLGGITSTGRIYIGGTIALIIITLWEIISSLLSILLLVLVVRLVALIIQKGTPFGSIWGQLDGFLEDITFKITNTFIKKSTKYKTQLIVTIITFVLIIVFGSYFFRSIAALCYKLPF